MHHDIRDEHTCQMLTTGDSDSIYQKKADESAGKEIAEMTIHDQMMNSIAERSARLNRDAEILQAYMSITTKVLERWGLSNAELSKANLKQADFNRLEKSIQRLFVVGSILKDAYNKCEVDILMAAQGNKVGKDFRNEIRDTIFVHEGQDKMKICIVALKEKFSTVAKQALRLSVEAEKLEGTFPLFRSSLNATDARQLLRSAREAMTAMDSLVTPMNEDYVGAVIKADGQVIAAVAGGSDPGSLQLVEETVKQIQNTKGIEEGPEMPPLSLQKAVAELEDQDCFFNFTLIKEKRPYNRNLVPQLLSGIGEICTNGQGTTMIVEEPPVGVDKREDIPRALATSYDWCRRLVEVDLVKEGIQEWVLDKIRPRIVISEWVAARVDCETEYEMYAQLLRPEEFFIAKALLPERFRKNHWLMTPDGQWMKMKMVFEDYPAGIRYICVMSGGKDSRFWRGNFGCKMANLEIRVELPDELRLLTPSDFPDGIKTETTLISETNVFGEDDLRNLRQ